MEITEKETEYIAGLARLELSPEELKLYASQLGSILSWVEQINAADTAGVAHRDCAYG